MHAKLREMIEGSEWEDQEEALGKLAKPCIELIKRQTVPAGGGSQLGGSPDLPPGFAWPHDPERPYLFLAQFCLDELGEAIAGLPSSGMLSFFVRHDESRECWHEPDFVKVFHFRETAGLRPVTPPAAVQWGRPCAVQLEEGVSLPHWPCRAGEWPAWPLDEDFTDAYEDLRAELCPFTGYLLGYQTNSSLAFDPTPKGGWSSLLTIRSNRELEWSWHDGGWLMIFVEDEKARAGDFSNLVATAG